MSEPEIITNDSQPSHSQVTHGRSLWSIINDNISRTHVWPLLEVKDAISAMLVNRVTSVDCYMWKPIMSSYINSLDIDDFIQRVTSAADHTKHHDPRYCIRELDIRTFFNKSQEQVTRVISILPCMTYLTKLSLHPFSVKKITVELPAYRDVTRSGGLLSNLSCLTHLRLDHWVDAIEAGSLPAQLKSLVLPWYECDMHPGCIPDSLTELNLHDARYGHQTFAPYPLPDGCVPNTLKRLILASESWIDWDDAPGIFPDQLAYLRIQFWDDGPPENQILFPASLTALSVYACEDSVNTKSFLHAFPHDSKLQVIYQEPGPGRFANERIGPFLLPDYLSHVVSKPTQNVYC